MKHCIFFILFALLAVMTSSAFAVDNEASHWTPPNGLVPDANTAVIIAEAVLIPIYGKKQIENEKPFHAALQKDRWIVEGTLHKEKVGGTSHVEVSKDNGAILRIAHSK